VRGRRGKKRLKGARSNAVFDRERKGNRMTVFLGEGPDGNGGTDLREKDSPRRTWPGGRNHGKRFALGIWRAFSRRGRQNSWGKSSLFRREKRLRRGGDPRVHGGRTRGILGKKKQAVWGGQVHQVARGNHPSKEQEKGGAKANAGRKSRQISGMYSLPREKPGNDDRRGEARL